jgi:hypothetical protein
MYNRYIPQPDGSYRKNAMPESRQNVQRQASQRPAPPTPPPPPPVQQRPPRQDSIPSFLRQLIPQGFDTGDLIIVLLLLLIAGDSQESRSNALLTLALYFIL